jgi:hypothetical protein
MNEKHKQYFQLSVNSISNYSGVKVLCLFLVQDNYLLTNLNKTLELRYVFTFVQKYTGCINQLIVIATRLKIFV